MAGRVVFVSIREQQEFDYGHVANESSMYFVPHLPSSVLTRLFLALIQ
jgi:hypothetical protein